MKNYLARPACLPGGLYSLSMFFSLYFYIFFHILNGQPRSKSISGTTERIFTKISGLVELRKGLINPAFIWWRSLKGCCHGNQLKVAKSSFFAEKCSCHGAIPKRIGISERQWAA